MRKKLQGVRGITINTCHGAFKLDKPEIESMPLMTMYDLVIVDEFSLLTKNHFERLMTMWLAAEKLSVLIFAGDKYQLPGMGSERPWHSAAWKKACKHIELHQMWRCADPSYARILNTLRQSKPK